MVDPNKLFARIHTHATGELTQLMNGFYHNIEDGLFELAYSNPDQMQQRHVVELMRELRFRRKQLLRTFGKRVQKSGQGWFGDYDSGPEMIEERMMANEIAAKCSSHFGPVLQSIAERTSHATNREVSRRGLPPSPEEVSYHFVMSCRSVKFDKYSVATVQSLFSRFVLDRLGAVYGQINYELEQAGYVTQAELADVAMPTSA
jgi:uncharacterized protein DUF1631